MTAARDPGRAAPAATPECGPLEGAWHGETAVFRGIPYAASPVGDLRFAPPRAHDPWQAPRVATAPGPAAPQGRSPLEGVLGATAFPQAEDGCLTLDVYTPGPGSGGGLPVLVWIHGGGFTTGYGGGPRQSGAGLAARSGLVVVTVNYRLGPLGYLYLAGLGEGFGAGNFGLLDQIAAVRWVRDNIAAFGGDPANVTVAGHSSGALSAAAVAVSPEAAHLVRRAILLSPQLAGVATAEAATAAAAEYLDVLGLAPGQLDELRRAPAEQLVKAADALAARKGPAGAAPALVAGGSAMPRTVLDAFADGGLPRTDLLVSTARDEARGFLFADPGMRSVSRAQVTGMLGQHAGERAAAVYDHYAARLPGAAPCDVAADALTDLLFRLPATRLCEIRAEAGAPAFACEFGWEPPAPGFGACHGVDLAFLLGDCAAWAGAPVMAGACQDQVEALALTYQAMLASFVRNGRPGPGPDPWPPYIPPNRTTMLFGTLVSSVNNPNGPERRLWTG